MDYDKEHLRNVFKDNIIKDNIEAFKILMPAYISHNLSFLTGFKLALDNSSFSIAKLMYQTNVKNEKYILNDILQGKIDDLNLPIIKFMYENNISIDDGSILTKNTRCIIINYKIN